MVAFSKMLAAGVVASFGVAGVSAGAVPKIESLLNHPAMGEMHSALAKMPAGVDMSAIEELAKNPEKLQEMQAQVMEQMEELEAQAEVQAEAEIAELTSPDFGQKGYEAELEALKAQLDHAKRVTDEYDNPITADASEIAELEKKIAKYENNFLFKKSRTNEIATKGADAAKLLKVQGEVTEILKETVESAQQLTEESTAEEKQAVEETMKEKMAGMLDHMNAAVQQAQSHMSAEDKAKQAEVLKQLTSGPMAGMMGPMAGMLENVLAGKPLTMEYLEEGAREMMYEQEEYRQKMLLKLEAEEAAIEEAVAEEILEEAAEEQAELLSIKEHTQ